jgi:hypothetical protein
MVMVAFFDRITELGWFGQGSETRREPQAKPVPPRGGHSEAQRNGARGENHPITPLRWMACGHTGPPQEGGSRFGRRDLMQATGESSTQLRHPFRQRLPKPLFLGAFVSW